MSKVIDDHMNMLKHSSLFQGLDEPEIEAVRGCLAPVLRRYKKGEFIIRSGDPITSVALLVKGTAIVIKEDIYGRRLILQEIAPGQVFAESFACLSKMPAEVSVEAQEDSEVMTFDVTSIVSVCPSGCEYHARVVRNLMMILADKNVSLTRKVDVLSKRTIRDRLLSYLSSESLRQGKSFFTIPYNRQQLADYLSVDRSALSAEISKLQKEGVLTSHRNEFHLEIKN